jgi:5-methylcytosine-specific restriction protein A
MPTLPKGNRPTLAVKARATVIKEKRRAFQGMDKSNTKLYKSKHWQKVRRLILNAQPICVHCEQNGRYITANTVDHIVPINKGGALFSLDNLQALCSSCHNKKSGKDRHG